MTIDPDKLPEGDLAEQANAHQEIAPLEQPTKNPDIENKPVESQSETLDEARQIEELQRQLAGFFGNQSDFGRMLKNNGTTSENLTPEQMQRYWRLEGTLDSPVASGFSFLKDYLKETFGRRPKEHWRKEGFSLYEELSQREGVFLEVGGPTPKGYEMVDFKKVNRDTGKKVFISNIKRDGHLSLADRTRVIEDEEVKKMGRIDFQADATKLPLEDGSVSGLFASCLSTRGKEVFEEAARVLEPDGIFVFQGCGINDIFECQQYDLELVEYTTHLAHYISHWGYTANIILKKIKGQEVASPPKTEEKKQAEDDLSESDRERMQNIRESYGELFDEQKNGSKRAEKILNSIKPFIESEKANLNGDDIVRLVQQCSSIQDREEFIDAAIAATTPVIELVRNNPELQREILEEYSKFIKINEALLYGVDKDSAHIHLAESRHLGISKVKKLILEGFGELAGVVDKNEAIKKITARSWIVAKNPRLMEQLGFIVNKESEGVEESGQKIMGAEISRDDFLNKYLKK